MTISYNLGVPAANNNPSNDQPDMLVNTQSISDIWAVDHVTFSGNPAGTHAQVTFSSKNTPGAQTDPQSVLYTRDGTASTVADLAFTNQNGTFYPNLIRAAAIVTSPTTLTQSFNVDSIVNNSTGVYTVTLTSGATTGTNIGVQINAYYAALAAGGGINASYQITGADTIRILFTASTSGFAGINPTVFNFLVWQL